MAADGAGPRAGGRGLLRQIGLVSVITGLSQVFFLAANVLLGRAMPPSDFGRVDLANKIINLAGYLGVFGLHNALVRSVPRQDLPRYRWPAALGRVAAGALVVAGAAGLIAGAVYHFTPWGVAALTAASWTFSLAVVGTAVLTIDRRFAPAQTILYLWRPILFVAALLLWLRGGLGVGSILGVYVGAGLLQAGALALALRPVPRGDAPLPAGKLMREGLLFFGLFLTSTLMLRLDAFLLAGLVDTAALGRYAACANIALTGYGVLSLGVSQVVSPRVASGESLGLKRLLLLLVAVGGGGGLLLTLFGTPLIHWLYAGRYPGDFTLLLALLCASGVIQVAYVVPSAWLGVRAPERALRFFLAINVLSVAINAGLNLWLIPRWGLPGAAFATGVSWVWRLAWAAGLAARLRAQGGSQPGPARSESAGGALAG